ncbi:hypothetical protein E2C01_009609 [Portunus trituberculatus]|uniref:Uncharacterized protein n=1 Tax=Portunus trituberculatus TaxID=210409 RepID=A0A5B7D685_PORTR|nr:hypothetical protein [Portunus trituberculatus]
MVVAVVVGAWITRLPIPPLPGHRQQNLSRSRSPMYKVGRDHSMEEEEEEEEEEGKHRSNKDVGEKMIQQIYG